jgi:hypothetical protein
MTEPHWKKYLVLKCPANGNWNQRYASFQDVLDRNELVGKLKGLKLSNVLRRSTLDQETYFVDPQFAVHVLAMGELLSAGNYSSCDSSSPGNADSFEFHATFLDGGVSHYSGNYFCGTRGTWASGMKVVRLLCFELGLPQPPKRSLESSKPLHNELLRAVAYSELDKGMAAQLARVRCFSSSSKETVGGSNV